MDNQQNVEPNQNIENVSMETDNQMNIFQSKNMIIGLLVILLVLSFLGINILLVIGNFFQAIINIFGPLVYQILGVFGYTAGAVINKTADVVSDTTKVGIDIAEGTVQSVGNLLIKSSGAVVDPNAKRLLDNAVDTPIRVKIPTPPPVYIPVPVPVPVPVEVKVPVYSPGSKNSSVSFNSLLNNPITRFLMYDPSKTPAPTVPLPTVPLPTVPLRTTAVPTAAVPTTAAPTTPAPTTAVPTTAVPTESASKIQNPISSNKISWCFTGEYQGKRGCVDVTDQSKCLSGQVFPSQQSCLATTKSSNPLISNPIVPTMSSTIPNYGNGTMMMNGLPIPPIPPSRPTIEQMQTMNPSLTLQTTATGVPLRSSQPTATGVPLRSSQPTGVPERSPQQTIDRGASPFSQQSSISTSPVVLPQSSISTSPAVFPQPTAQRVTGTSPQLMAAGGPMAAGISTVSQQPMAAGISTVSQQPMAAGSSSISQQQILANAPFLPYIPPQTNAAVIQGDGPPLVNGPINYFYTYSDRLATGN
jgi:hypothetical protein